MMKGEKRARMGILGGTFNPVHLGHLLLAQMAADVYELPLVLLIPCATPPHKRVKEMAAPEHRLAMLEAVAESDLQLEVSDMEIRRGGVSFAVDTVKQLGEQYPESDLFFIIGGDTLTELHQWRRITDLLEMCRFVTFKRPGVRSDALGPQDVNLPAPWPERLLQDVNIGRQIDISSSDIRYRVAEGMSIRYLVPPEVEMYIAEHGLYRG